VGRPRFEPVTNGDTYEEAVCNGLLAVEDVDALAEEYGEPLPALRFLQVTA
jgi:predicted RNase H-like HicB family nuclease